MHRVSLPSYTLHVADSLPSLYAEYCAHAEFVDEIDLRNSDGGLFFLGIAKDGDDWPGLISAQKYEPDQRSGFSPGVLVIPETARAFVGAGTRLLCYDLSSRTRVWEDVADMGFLRWYRSGHYVLMLAEVEFAVWSIQGKKLWSVFVDPPAEVAISVDGVTLQMFDGQTSRHRLADGVAF